MSYREPHLQKKSDECAELWREWFSFFNNPKKRNTPECKKAREKWSKCVEEFGDQISEEVKTNSRYINLKV